jgi:hypothetical protein
MIELYQYYVTFTHKLKNHALISLEQNTDLLQIQIIKDLTFDAH